MASKTLDEVLAENTDLANKVASITTELASEKAKVTKLDGEKSELQTKLTSAEGSVKTLTTEKGDLQTKLDAANKELGDLKSKEMDVEKRAAAIAAKAGISTTGKEKETPATTNADKPKSWKDDAKAHFETKSKGTPAK